MKYFFFFAVLLYVSAATGQEVETQDFQKGGYMVGVNGLGGFNSGSAYRNPRWSIAPWAGYFVGTNLAAGLRVSYGWDVFELKGGASGEVSDYRYTSVAPEAFLRYYVHALKIKPFVQVGVGYNFQWGEPGNADGQTRASNIIGSAEGGLRFPIGRKFSLDASYNWRAFSPSAWNDANERNRWRLGVSLRL